MWNNVDYSLYLVTDRGLLAGGVDIVEAVEAALRGGCTVVQLREKEASSLEFYRIACRLMSLTRRHGVPLIINDRVDIALAAGADGVHVGQGDLPVEVVRGLVGKGCLVGVSVSTVAEAVAAVAGGADYLGVGAMFATGTKTDAVLVGMEELRRIRAAVPVPIVAIGGIGLGTIAAFRGTGIDGVAVVSAILAQGDIEAAAVGIKKALHSVALSPRKGEWDGAPKGAAG